MLVSFVPVSSKKNARTCNGRDVRMLSLRLHGGLRRVTERASTKRQSKIKAKKIGEKPDVLYSREQSTRDTKHDLSPDDTSVSRVGKTTSVSNQEPKGDHEQATTENNERLELTDPVDNDTEQSTGDDGCKRVERSDSSGRLDGFIERDDEDGVKVGTLHVPRKVQDTSDTESCPDTSVLEKLERHKRVSSLAFPENEDRDAAESNHERCD
jgi:hypothetical protein